jgi:hypothetical protein
LGLHVGIKNNFKLRIFTLLKGDQFVTLRRRKILILMVLIVVLSQLIPINRTNPPVTAKLVASQDVNEIFSRSCFDCHSNETVWPWYSWIAPISWLVAVDVYEGRDHLNISIWGEYSTEKQTKLKKEIRETIKDGEMPPFQYLLAHPDARLSKTDQEILLTWAGFITK